MADATPAAGVAPDAPLEKLEPGAPDGPDEAVDAAKPDPPDANADVALDAAQSDLASTMSDSCLPPALDAASGDGLRRFLDLVVRGEGFEEHEGNRVYVFTREMNSKAPLGYGSDVVRAGQFTVRFPDGYGRFSYQRIYYYVDVNGDRRCDESTGDHPGFMVSNALNPGSNDPQEQLVQDNHRSMERDERVCDLMNACH